MLHCLVGVIACCIEFAPRLLNVVYTIRPQREDMLGHSSMVCVGSRLDDMSATKLP